MKLLFKRQHIGDISAPEQDGPEVWGNFNAASNASEFIEMWKFMENDENSTNDPPVPPEFLDDSNWLIVDDTEARRPIHLPAVYSDGVIGWRWRQ